MHVCRTTGRYCTCVDTELALLREVEKSSRQVIGALTGKVPGGVTFQYAAKASWHDGLYATIDVLIDDVAKLDAHRKAQGAG